MKKFIIHVTILLFSAAVIFLSTPLYHLYLVNFEYKSTTGKILKSGIEQIEQEEDCGEDCSKTVITFRPKIAYEYQIENIKYIGTRYRFSTRGEDKSWAENIAGENLINQEVVVFYHQQFPERSVLSEETPKEYGVNLLGFAGLSIIGFFAIYAVNFGTRKSFYQGFENLVSDNSN